MTYDDIKDVVDRIKGVTFASLDAIVYPVRGNTVAKKTITQASVMLFRMEGSGYANTVRRRLIQEGKDSRSFELYDLPWGERVNNGPIIEHNGEYYLQCIVLSAGNVACYVGNKEVAPAVFQSAFGRGGRDDYHQGLTAANAVIVRTFALKNITAMRILKETRPVLGLRHE